jgi:hypothetical protein
MAHKMVFLGYLYPHIWRLQRGLACALLQSKFNPMV